MERRWRGGCLWRAGASGRACGLGGEGSAVPARACAPPGRPTEFLSLYKLRQRASGAAVAAASGDVILRPRPSVRPSICRPMRRRFSQFVRLHRRLRASSASASSARRHQLLSTFPIVSPSPRLTLDRAESSSLASETDGHGEGQPAAAAALDSPFLFSRRSFVRVSSPTPSSSGTGRAIGRKPRPSVRPSLSLLRPPHPVKT